jgi:hypothetical protein
MPDLLVYSYPVILVAIAVDRGDGVSRRFGCQRSRAASCLEAAGVLRAEHGTRRARDTPSRWNPDRHWPMEDHHGYGDAMFPQRQAEPPTNAWKTEPTTEQHSVRDQIPTELRVHGVSGSPAEEMLDRPLIRQVAGDREAGFFRPRSEYGGTFGPGGARLEAYRWGNLTSGAAARAFWLLLLPFGLANVALWMRPPATGMGRRIVHGLIRIFCLTMSATLTLATVGIALDLLAWQCAAPDSVCVQQRPFLTGLFTGFFEPTGRRLALAALVPIGLVSLLWFLAVRSWARYESYGQTERNPDGDGLAIPSFWDGRAQVGRLRSVHIAVMFALIDGMILYVLIEHDRSGNAYAGVDLGGMTWQTMVRIGEGLGIAAIAITALSLFALFLPSIVDRVSQSRAATAFARSLRILALLLTALTLAYAAAPRAAWPTNGPLPGYAKAVTYLFAGQAVLLTLLLLVVAFQRHRAKGAFLGGFGAPIIASLGLGLGAAFSAGASYRVADYLDGSAVPSPAEFGADPSQLRLEPPLQYQWAAVGFVLLVLVVLVALLWARFVLRPVLVRRARATTDDDFPGGRARDRGRARQLDKSIANAWLTDQLSLVVGVAWLVIALGGLAATGFALYGKGPVQLAGSDSTAARALSIVANVGTYLISASILLLVVLGVQTYRNARVRRTVGVVWDLATFWPRSAHPLAPPCYAERVVPELVHRGTWLATEHNGLVVSGHSQGSILAVATVLQLPPEARAKTALLTYGSPLRRLYLRAFPLYFNEKVINDIAATVAGDRGQERWVNLWRQTDPIGGAIGVGDRRLADPDSFGPVPGDRIPPAVKAHSGYQVTPQFEQAMDDLVGLLEESTPQTA